MDVFNIFLYFISHARKVKVLLVEYGLVQPKSHLGYLESFVSF